MTEMILLIMWVLRNRPLQKRRNNVNKDLKNKRLKKFNETKSSKTSNRTTLEYRSSPTGVQIRGEWNNQEIPQAH
jgi:hypothetical protein